METEITEAIKALTEKAKAADAHDALHYSQAALNLAHAHELMKPAGPAPE